MTPSWRVVPSWQASPSTRPLESCSERRSLKGPMLVVGSRAARVGVDVGRLECCFF